MRSSASGTTRALYLALRTTLFGLPGAYCLALSSAALTDVLINPGSTLDFYGSEGWKLPILLIVGTVLMLLSVNRLREPQYTVVFAPVPFLVCAAPLLREVASPLSWVAYALVIMWPALTFALLRRLRVPRAQPPQA